MSFRGIVLEGVTGTGKSSLFNELRRSALLEKADSKLLLSQTYTLRVAPSASPHQLLSHLKQTVWILFDLFRTSEFAMRDDGRGSFLYVLEGFHYYMALEHLPPQRRARFVRRMDRWLKEAGALLVALHVPPEEVLESCVRSTMRFRGAGWRQFLQRFGTTEEEIAAYYRERQASFLALLEESELPVLRLDTSGRNWPELCARIEDFVRQQGRLP